MTRGQANTVMLDVALQFYVKHGLAIFPCAQKKPLTKDGFKAATVDEATIRRWWTEHPKAQVGLPCGARNHLLVVDSDGSQGNEWIKKQDWPRTLTVETSPGHFQLYFRQPDGIVTKPSASQVAPQVDIRGDGSYIIGAFSFHHRTHKPYLIVRSIDGLQRTGNPLLPWADAPQSLLALVTVNAGTTPAGGGDSIPQGRRHATLLSLAGSFRARGFSPETVLANLRIANAQQCKPPIEDDDLRRLAQFVGKKPAGFRGQRSLETSAEVDMEAYSDVKREKVCWLRRGRIARGKLNLYVGDPGLGKSLATCDMAAHVSTGTAFPDGAECERGDVLILSAEDDPRDTIGPRLAAAGADLSRVHRVKCVKVILPDGQTGESTFNLERDLEKLDEKLDNLSSPIVLLIIDPLSAYMGQRIDTHVDAAVRSVLAPLADFAARRSIAVIGVMHLRKSEASALLRVSGSVGFAAAARIIWGFGPDPDNPDRRIMVPVKNNLAPLGQGLAYRITVDPGEDAPRLEWLKDEVTLSPDEVLNSDPRHKHARAHRQERAEEWLKELLSSGPVPQQRVEDAADREQFSWRTVVRAKAALRVRSVKGQFGWLWELPGQGCQTP